MSLAKRIALSVTLLLAIISLPVGWFFYQSMAHSLESELQGRLNTRMAWIESCLEIGHEEEGFELEFEVRNESETAAEYWVVTLGDKEVLWEDGPPKAAAHLIELSKKESFGEEGQSRLKDEDFVTYIKKDRHNRYKSFRDGRFDLNINVFTSRLGVDNRLKSLVKKLWLSGISLLLLLAILFTALINWQLAPLKKLSERAEKIGVDNLAESLPVLGTASECVALRDSINNMLQRLAQGMDRERQFSSMAAHELRTPLAQLRTEIEVTLRKERQVSEYKESLNAGLKDVERLQSLIQGLLQLTRLNENNKIAGRAVSLYEILTKLKKKSPAFVIKEEENISTLMLIGDEELILSALFNVIENASRYGGDGEIQISFKRAEDKFYIIISDEGRGIESDQRENIFEALTRLDQARSVGSDSEGFGLGLSVARSITRAFGGELSCRQREDGLSGAEFVFEFRIS